MVSSCVGTEDAIEATVSIHPVPASDIITISNSSNGIVSGVTFYTTQGQIINADVNTTNSIDVSGLDAGYYLLSFDIDGVNHREKIMIE